MALEKILVDSIKYRIEKTNDVIILNGQQCAADVDYNLGLIRINEEIFQSGAAAQVLMHEIVHALLNSRGKHDASDDEELVDALAAGFINLVRTNPKLINFLTELESNG